MTLADWLAPLLTAPEMRAVDAWAIGERGVASLELMERAGRGVAELTAERVPAGRVAVVCGKGNNGGDGLVAARHLRDAGREVEVLLCGASAGELEGDPRASLHALPGARPRPFEPAALQGVAGVVDALLGTGFAGEPREPVRGAIEAINAGGATVIAADGPSGVDASSGAVAGAAVRAHATATFHAAKPGLWVSPGKRHAGAVRVLDIGIPAGAPGDPGIGLISRAVLGAVPRRGAASTKFASGNVLVCGGSSGLTGAPTMAAEAAMRAGAGYVTACVPASLHAIFELKLLEVMTVPLPGDGDGGLVPDACDVVLGRAGRGGALVLGPGLGRAEGALELARRLAREADLPVLLDADGLNAHAGRLADLAARRAPTVLTPHPGELHRLLGVGTEEIAARRLDHARAAAEAAGAVTVLKGDDTIVAQPGGPVAVSPGGSPALATAGTGDVLSGAIGALLAKGMDTFTAACAGVYAHAAAGRLVAEAHGPEGVIASDVIAALPRALADS